MIDTAVKSKTGQNGPNSNFSSGRNTPTILKQSENPIRAVVSVAEDGSTTVGNYKLGKFQYGVIN